MYRLIEKASKISECIKFSKENKAYRHPEKSAIQADNEWGASYLLAMLMFESTVIPCTYIYEEELNIFRQEFESKGRTFDFDGLMDKFWIRVIAGIVEIPSGIQSAATQYEKIKGAEAEFYFLVETAENFNKIGTISKPDFLSFLNEYQNSKGLIISLERCKEFHWLEDKDDTIKIFNLAYNKPIFQFQNEFRFIGFLLEKQSQGNRYKLAIQYDTLLSLYRKHKNFFPKTPSLDDLLAQKVIEEENGSYLVNILGCSPDYWEAHGSKIGVLLYSTMQGTGRYLSSKTLLKEWLLKIEFINDMIGSPENMKHEDIEPLLNCCLDMLLNEKDLIGTDIEINKLVLSRRESEYVILSNAPKIGFPDLTGAKDIFELFNLMEDCDNLHNSDFLWMQGSRWFVHHLIQLIVFFDTNSGEDGLGYSKVRKLLAEGISRPYLLWKTCFFIHCWKPEIIPYLCLDAKVAPLAFNLIFISNSSTVLSGPLVADIKKDILCNCFKLLLSVLKSTQNIIPADKAKIIFQCLVLIAENKWPEYRNDSTMQVIEKRDGLHAIFQGLAGVLRNKINRLHSHAHLGEAPVQFYNEILPNLFHHIVNYDAQNIYPESVVGLPLVKLELLSLLLNLIHHNSDKRKKAASEELEEDSLVHSFLSTYIDTYNISTVYQWSYQDAKMETTTPIWATHQKGLELIPWEKWALLLENLNLLPEFLTPNNFKLIRTDDKWDSFNRFTIDKIRKHLEILILIHQRLRKSEPVFKQQGFKVVAAISRLEQSIADYVSKYSIEDITNARLDILDDRHERTIFGSQENALIPLLAQALNKFDEGNKMEVLKSLTKTDSFTKCLKLLGFLSSESDIDFIKKQIKEFDVASYLDEKNYIPEIETVVVRLSEFEGFIGKAKEALAYWEKRVLTKRGNTEYLITHFRIKLLIAYYESDEVAILSEKAPPTDSFYTSQGFEFKPEETRSFYLGLVKLKNNEPEDAYKIFNGLIQTSNNDKPSIAINRFYSHISFGKLKDNIEEREKTLYEALMEWDAYESGIQEKGKATALEYVKENIWLNKLAVYHMLKWHSEFDILFSSLDKSYQLRKDFFEIRVTNLVNRGQYELAKSFVSEAKIYHQPKDGVLSEFIRIAIEKLENEEDYKRLRLDYLNLISMTPEKLVQILPENIIGKRDLNWYLLKEICGSANDVLNNINSIEKIDMEDKYSDLLILSLQARLKNWYWKVGNARGGFSASNKRNNGELDFIITTADNERVATCEALLLHGKNTGTSTSHILKSFNYDHRRALFFILAYYSGNNYEAHWEDYKTNIVPNIQYPIGFPISESCEEIAGSLTNNSIRILNTRHGNGTSVYHIFMNINYKLPAP
jgi:hypothetical protein